MTAGESVRADGSDLRPGKIQIYKSQSGIGGGITVEAEGVISDRSDGSAADLRRNGKLHPAAAGLRQAFQISLADPGYGPVCERILFRSFCRLWSRSLCFPCGRRGLAAVGSAAGPVSVLGTAGSAGAFRSAGAFGNTGVLRGAGILRGAGKRSRQSGNPGAACQ